MEHSRPPASYGPDQTDFAPFDFEEWESTNYASDVARQNNFALEDCGLADPVSPFGYAASPTGSGAGLFDNAALATMGEYGRGDNAFNDNTVDPSLLSLPYYPGPPMDEVNQGSFSTYLTPTVDAGTSYDYLQEPTTSLITDRMVLPTAGNDLLAANPAKSHPNTDLIRYGTNLQEDPTPPFDQMT